MLTRHADHHYTAGLPMACTILDRHELTEDTALYRIGPAKGKVLLSDATPGRFVQLSVPAGGEIPVSLAGLPMSDGSVELCVRRVGRVTNLLHRLPAGSPVGLRGAFGQGFPLTEMVGNDLVLLAGGLGIAPLRGLLQALLARRDDFGAIALLYGAREPGLMPFREELAERAESGSFRLLLTVEFVRAETAGGYSCNVGLLPELLHHLALDPTRTMAAICGPPALYRCLIPELLAQGLLAERIYLSLERRMQCGTGQCSHCAVGHFLCCTDGPVFRYAQLADLSEAR